MESEITTQVKPTNTLSQLTVVQENRTNQPFDLGSESLYQLISDKLLESYTSKLCVLAIGFSSAALSYFISKGRKDVRKNVTIILADREEDQIMIRDKARAMAPQIKQTTFQVIDSNLETMMPEIKDKTKKQSRGLNKRTASQVDKKRPLGELEELVQESMSRASLESSCMEEKLQESRLSQASNLGGDSLKLSAANSNMIKPAAQSSSREVGAGASKPIDPKSKKLPKTKQGTTYADQFVDMTVSNTKQKRTSDYKNGGTFLTTTTKFCLDLVEQVVNPDVVDKIIVVNQYEIKDCSPVALGVNILHRFNPDAVVLVLVNDPFRVFAKERYAALMKNLNLFDCQFWPIYREELQAFFQRAEPESDQMNANTIPAKTGEILPEKTLIEELLIEESNPKIKSAQERLINILKSVLQTLKQDYQKKTGEVLPILPPDLIEMSNGELDAKFSNMPVGYTSDFVEDIRRVRSILFSFGGFSYGGILRGIDNFETWISDYPWYKGFNVFPSAEYHQFVDFTDEILSTQYEIKAATNDSWSTERLEAMKIWAEERLNHKLGSLEYQINIRLRKPPKLQVLLDLIRDEGQKQLEKASQRMETNQGTQPSQSKLMEETKVLVLCNNGMASNLMYTIQNYFSAEKPSITPLEIINLLFYLTTKHRLEARKRGLAQAKNSEYFQKALLEMRLCEEIVAILESGQGFMSTQISGLAMQKEDTFTEIHAQPNPAEGEDAPVQGDLKDRIASITGFYSTSIESIYQQMEGFKGEFEKHLPLLLQKLVVFPHHLGAELLKSVNRMNIDELGNFVVNAFVIPGVNLKVVDFRTMMRSPELLREFQPNKVIMFNHNNYFMRVLQYSNFLNHSMQVSVLVGESYLEGWLYKVRDERESETFMKLINCVAKLHGVRSNSHDKVILDEGLITIGAAEESNLSLLDAGGLPTINKEGPMVLVDKREFCSETPGLLYFNGFKVIPVLLKTGDYILCNETVVERKAFNDLKSSLKDGRLENQIVQMKNAGFTRIYILVEFFDGSKLSDLNAFLSHRQVAQSISVYKTAQSSARYNLNFAGLVELLRERLCFVVR